MPEFPDAVGPKIERRPVHPTINEAQISNLVDQFYTKVRAHQRLGVLFAQVGYIVAHECAKCQ